MADPLAPDAAPRPALPRAIWVLGFVSLLTDISSELVHSLLPMFLVGTMGVSVLAVGLIEGTAEATALITKVFSGAFSDALRRRKPLVLLGYTLSALTKPAFALAHGAGLVVAARCVDRVGKGLRDAPRDALVADLVPSERRGAAYGLRQALDTVGAFVGPLLATGLMIVFMGDYRAVFWVAVIPAVLAALLVAFGVREAAAHVPGPVLNPLRREALARLGPGFRRVAVVGGLFTLARFSEAFLVLRSQELGIAAALVPLVMVTMNLVYAIGAYPFGWLADRVSRLRLLALGLVLLIGADLVLASAQGWPGLLAGLTLWGLHMAVSQGLLAAMVADTAPADLRGTAFGLYNLIAGLSLLAASGIAGALWQTWGSRTTFLAGAAFALTALLALRALSPRGR